MQDVARVKRNKGKGYTEIQKDIVCVCIRDGQSCLWPVFHTYQVRGKENILHLGCRCQKK